MHKFAEQVRAGSGKGSAVNDPSWPLMEGVSGGGEAAKGTTWYASVLLVVVSGGMIPVLVGVQVWLLFNTPNR